MTTDHPSPDHVLPLTDKLAALLAESQALRGDVHGAELARRRAGTINLVLLAVLAALVLSMLAVTWQTHQSTRRLDETNARMADCTTPGGRCYEEGRARTGGAITDIIRSEVFMAECARLYPTESGPAYDRKLEACVMERLAGPDLRQPTPATPGPSPTR
jgi:hypothetical protein